MPASRVYRRLKQGGSAFSVMVKSAELGECCLWSKVPVYATDVGLSSKTENTIIDNKDQLMGKRVITLHGYKYGNLIDFIADRDNNIERLTTPSHSAAFAMLEAGRGDYLLDYHGPSVVPSNESNDSDQAEDRRFHFQHLVTLDLYMVINKSRPNATQLMTELELAFATIDRPSSMAAPGKPSP